MKTECYPRRRRRWLVALAASLVAILAPLALAQAGRADQSPPATYSATVTIPVPPASNFAGQGGGDGWGLAFTNTAVYNVFHHSSSLTVACHNQTDATPCWSPETITDSSNLGFAVNGQPGLWIDQGTGKLYIYATRSDNTGGVVCVDTTQAPTNTDPFCGFTALTAVGDAPLNGGLSTISAPIFVGDKAYAFNYANGDQLGGHNHLLCFNRSTLAACDNQPYAVTLGIGLASVNSFPNPAVALIGSQMIIPINLNESDELACYDFSTGGNCQGSWPVSLGGSGYVSAHGAPFPLLDSSGTLAGVCLPTGTDPCYDLSGGSVATPANLSSVVTGNTGGNTGWNGQALVFGPRVYVPNGNANGGEVECFDYSTGASCASFPHALPGSSYLYTVNLDPQRPTCIWTNSDNGNAQIQNFDAYTGGACGAGATRVLASNIVAPDPTCNPYNYSSLQVLAPTPDKYTSGTVKFEDPDGNPIPGAPDATLDNQGTVDLSSLNLNTNLGKPQFVITLAGTQGSPSEVTVKLTWKGAYNQRCFKPGTQVTPPPTSSQATPPPTPTPTPTPKPKTPAHADLLVTVTTSRGKLYAGKGVTYTFTVTNRGPDAATQTLLSRLLPAGLKLVSLRTSQGSCSHTASVTCSLGTIPKGSKVTIVLVARPSHAGHYRTKPHVASPVSDPNAVNNVTTKSIVVRALFCQAPFNTAYDSDDNVPTVAIYLDGHLARTLHGRDLRRITVSQLRADRRYSVRVVFTLDDGRQVVQSRSVHGCAVASANQTIVPLRLSALPLLRGW